MTTQTNPEPARQETIEEAANKYAESLNPNSTGKQMIDAYKAFKQGTQ